MSLSFNLLEEAWLPCITVDGEFVEVSLRGLFARAPGLREISCATAIQSAAVMPLALAILHRVFGPEGMGEWHTLWQAGAFDMARLDAYFEQWRDRFDLFHPERPFYQVSDDRVKRKSILYLAEKIQNTHTLFNHTTEAQAPNLTPAQAARRLLQAQAFRLRGGRSGAKTPYDVDSIYSRGVLFFAQGSNLFQTLMLNLVRYPDERILSTPAKDKPFWERDDPWQGRKPGASKATVLTPSGYLDYLTWQTNHVELFYDSSDGVVKISDITIVPVSKLAEGVRSPQKQHEKREKKGEISYSPLRFREDRALWRNYHSLLPQSDGKSQPPAVIDWLSNLTLEHLPEDFPVRLLATGMLADEAKPIFYRRELMPLPLELLRNADYVRNIGEAIQKAEACADKLRNALHPASVKTGNLGAHIRALDPQMENDATERRFVQLLRMRRDTLEPRLRQQISILKAKDIPVNWHQLMRDVRHWDHENRFVQRNWASGFWRINPSESDSQ